MTARCSYQWAVVAYKGAPSVMHYRRCKNRTTDESGRCWLHRGLQGRYDRRVSS